MDEHRGNKPKFQQEQGHLVFLKERKITIILLLVMCT